MINNYEYKIIQFADDTSLFSLFDQETIDKAIHTLSKFERNSGLKLIYEKSSVYRIGSFHNSNAQIYIAKELVWTNDPIKMLGIEICGDREVMLEKTTNKCWKKSKPSLIPGATEISVY